VFVRGSTKFFEQRGLFLRGNGDRVRRVRGVFALILA
jgi:hypothetical protein